MTTQSFASGKHVSCHITDAFVIADLARGVVYVGFQQTTQTKFFGFPGELIPALSMIQALSAASSANGWTAKNVLLDAAAQTTQRRDSV